MRPELLRAKMHQVEIAWRLKTTREVVIGPAPRLVLALRALRDVTLRTLRLDFPDLRTAEGEAETLVCELPHVVGTRLLDPEGEPWVDGQEDLDGSALIHEALPLKAQRWHGGTAAEFLHNVNAHPAYYWAAAAKVHVPRGLCVGLLVRATRPTACRARLAGTD